MPSIARKSTKRTSEPPPSGNRPATMRPPAPGEEHGDCASAAAEVTRAIEMHDRLSRDPVAEVASTIGAMDNELLRAMGALACALDEEETIDREPLGAAMSSIAEARRLLRFGVRHPLARAGVFGVDDAKGAA